MLRTPRTHRNMFWDHLTLPNIGNSRIDLQISTLSTRIGTQNLPFRSGVSQETFGSWIFASGSWILASGSWILDSRLWIVNCALLIVKYELLIVSCELWIVNCELWIVNCELRIMNYELWIMNYDWWLWLMIMISQHPPLGGSKAYGVVKKTFSLFDFFYKKRKP